MISASSLLPKTARRCCTTTIAQRAISSSQLTVELSKDDTRFQNQLPKEKLAFGKTLADHMLMIEWDEKNKWSAPKIVPQQDLRLSPAAACLHYGTYSMLGAYLLIYLTVQ